MAERPATSASASCCARGPSAAWPPARPAITAGSDPSGIGAHGYTAGPVSRRLSRRVVIAGAGVAPLACLGPRGPGLVSARATDIRVVEVAHAFQEFHYRAPYKFGGREVDRTTLLNVNCRVRTGD